MEDPAALERLARELHAGQDSRRAYEAYLNLVSRLTNPLVPQTPDLRGLLDRLDRGTLELAPTPYYFLPPSRALETELVKRLYGDRPIPGGFSLVDEMIARIRAGELDLEPGEDSGWYDYQTWALEPLVVPEKMPEGGKLQLTDEYREQLEQLFKGIMALTRETHAKQLEIPMAGAAAPPDGPKKPRVVVQPDLSVEPLYSYYLRRAIAYRFVQQVLEESFGEKALSRMHRVTPEGPVKPNLDEELREVSGLFHGASAVVAEQLGLAGDPQELGSGQGGAADAAAFQRWAQAGRDVDLDRDARMMVPVFYDFQRSQIKVWSFLGWTSRAVSVSFARAPEARVYDRRGSDVTDGVDLVYGCCSHRLAYPVFAEIYVSRLLDRDEFRRHCDRYQTRQAILEHLR
jgi:hypothetical protein